MYFYVRLKYPHSCPNFHPQTDVFSLILALVYVVRSISYKGEIINDYLQ